MAAEFGQLAGGPQHPATPEIRSPPALGAGGALRRVGLPLLQPWADGAARVIAPLRSMDMPIAEIRRIVSGASEAERHRIFRDHRARLEARLEEVRRLLDAVDVVTEEDSVTPATAFGSTVWSGSSASVGRTTPTCAPFIVAGTKWHDAATSGPLTAPFRGPFSPPLACPPVRTGTRIPALQILFTLPGQRLERIRGLGNLGTTLVRRPPAPPRHREGRDRRSQVTATGPAPAVGSGSTDCAGLQRFLQASHR
jgi:hypothetical protein